jgi:hypothetical protein
VAAAAASRIALWSSSKATSHKPRIFKGGVKKVGKA